VTSPCCGCPAEECSTYRGHCLGSLFRIYGYVSLVLISRDGTGQRQAHVSIVSREDGLLRFRKWRTGRLPPLSLAVSVVRCWTGFPVPSCIGTLPLATRRPVWSAGAVFLGLRSTLTSVRSKCRILTYLSGCQPQRKLLLFFNGKSSLFLLGGLHVPALRSAFLF